VKVDGNVIGMTPWDNSLNTPAPLTKTAGCGENRYVGVENFVEFYITAGCEVLVEPTDAIHAKVRMEWTLAEFYADGGTDRFADRLAAVLGIHPSRIKTVAAYQGSVIVDFFITTLLQTVENDSPSKVQDEISEITESIKKVFTDAKADLGAPLLGAEGNDELLWGSRIPAGPVTGSTGFGGQSTAIQLEDNIWDRYQRIQEVVERQRTQEVEESLFGSDVTAESVQRAENIIIEKEYIDGGSGNTVKFTILIIASLILVSLAVTAVCVYKCFTKQRRHIASITKAQMTAHEQKQDADTQSQFAPKGDDSLYTSVYNTSTKVNIKGQDSVLDADLPGTQNHVELVTKGKNKRKAIAPSVDATDRFAQTNSKLNIQKVNTNMELVQEDGADE